MKDNGIWAIGSRYKLPRSTVILPELPHNAAGKLLRAKLKENA